MYQLMRSEGGQTERLSQHETAEEAQATALKQMNGEFGWHLPNFIAPQPLRWRLYNPHSGRSVEYAIEEQ